MPIIVDDHSESLNDVEIQNMSKHDEDAEAIDFFKDKYLKEENDESQDPLQQSFLQIEEDIKRATEIANEEIKEENN